MANGRGLVAAASLSSLALIARWAGEIDRHSSDSVSADVVDRPTDSGETHEESARHHDPAMDTSAFPSPLGGYYWSSTPYSWTGGQWAVDFTSGLTCNGNVGNAIYVRCVHD